MFPLWYNYNIRTLSDIYGEDGLLAFQDIRDKFTLGNSSFFFYLQLRTALKAHGAPIDTKLSIHPLFDLIQTKTRTRGLVSHIYQFILSRSYKPLALDEVWRNDIPELNPNFNWRKTWDNIILSSRNPEHQLIHFNFVHRTYLTPRRLCHMKFLDSPLCTLCTDSSMGTFLHMVWECRPVATFWHQITNTLSSIMGLNIQLNPAILILNDLSSVEFTNLTQRRIFLAGLTAAKKMIAVRWKPPHSLSMSQWCLTFLDIIYLEISTARIHGAKQENILPWFTFADKLKAELSI